MFDTPWSQSNRPSRNGNHYFSPIYHRQFSPFVPSLSRPYYQAFLLHKIRFHSSYMRRTTKLLKEQEITLVYSCFILYLTIIGFPGSVALSEAISFNSLRYFSSIGSLSSSIIFTERAKSSPSYKL